MGRFHLDACQLAVRRELWVYDEDGDFCISVDNAVTGASWLKVGDMLPRRFQNIKAPCAGHVLHHFPVWAVESAKGRIQPGRTEHSQEAPELCLVRESWRKQRSEPALQRLSCSRLRLWPWRVTWICKVLLQ